MGIKLDMNTIVLIVLIILFFLFVAYNTLVLKILGQGYLKFVGVFHKLLGRHIKRAQVNLFRSAFLNQKSTSHGIYKFFDRIIDDMNMQNDGVSVLGLIIFITVLSILMSLGLNIILNLGVVFIFSVVAFFALITIVFKFTSIASAEKRVMAIMDTEDLLVSDISGGVYNAIIRYTDSMSPYVQPYFIEFRQNIQENKFSFTDAMLMLNSRLGYTFTNFARKAITFEAKADKEMVSIFSNVIDVNQQKRIVMDKNKVKFERMRIGFITSLSLIVLYAFFISAGDSFIHNFLLTNIVGKIMCIGDVVLVAGVLAYLTYLRVSVLR